MRVWIAGVDRRLLTFRRTIESEPFARGEFSGTFCVMNREKVGRLAPPCAWYTLSVAPLVHPVSGSRVLMMFNCVQGNPISWRQV